MKRHASATWWGDIKEGRGEITTQSGTLEDTAYSFATRFEDEKGTNPEELIGAAHAGCFSMALSGILARAGTPASRIDTRADVTLEKVEAGFAITGVHLSTRLEVPGADTADLEQAAREAKEGCPVSAALDVEITLDVTVVS